MTRIHHFNGGYLHVPPNPRVGCHCLLLEDANGLALVDTGIGLADVRDPDRIGATVINLAGFQFEEANTLVRQLTQRGFTPEAVTHIVLTHGDPDHIGGAADFPHATLHLSAEEQANMHAGNGRYCAAQFNHAPHWQPHATGSRTWFGLEARPLPLGFAAEVLLVPLFGHTLGHCGVAVQQESGWLLHVGDAYYLRVELETDDHPVSHIAALRADDDAQRRASITQLRRLRRDHPEVRLFGYHDLGEWDTVK